MPETLHPRQLGQIDYAANARKTLEIDRDGVLMELSLRLQYTITNAATPPTTPLFQTLAALLKRVEVIIGGRDTVISIDGPGLAARAQYEFGNVPFGMSDTVVLTANAATTYDVILPIIAYLPRGIAPMDTGLDLRRVGQAALAVTWGAIGDFYGTDNGATISNVTLDVEAEYLLDVDPNRAFLVRNLDMVEEELTGTTDNFSILMDKGTGLFYRSFMLVTLADNVGVNTILNTSSGKITVEAGSFQFQARDPAQYQALNKREFNQETLITGVYHIPTTKFGRGVTLINTGLLSSDLNLKLSATKVAGTNLIRVYREAIRPLKI